MPIIVTIDRGLDTIMQERYTTVIIYKHTNSYKQNYSEGLPVIKLIADGHELGIIQRFFENVPMTVGNSPVVWRKDMAQFIWDNLPNNYFPKDGIKS